MKKTICKVLSIILAAAILLSSAPLTIFALDTETGENTDITSSDESNLISIDRNETYSDASFIHYGTPKFFDSAFEYSMNSIVSNDSTAALAKVKREGVCPTTSGFMLEIPNNGTDEGANWGFKQNLSVRACGEYYHAIIAKIPQGYVLQANPDPYYTYNLEELTSMEGTGKWELYVFHYSIEAKVRKETGYTGIGEVNVSKVDDVASDTNKWVVGYSNIFEKTEWSIFNDGFFETSSNSTTKYNNSQNTSNTVSLTRVAKNSDCPSNSKSNYMMQIQTAPGTSSPGLGGFFQETTPEKGYTYYHKMLAKIPEGYYLRCHYNSISADFEWLTDNTGTGNWETYIYKVTVDKNAQNLGTFGFVALHPNSSESYGNGSSIQSTETVTWYLGYSNIFKCFEIDEDFKSAELMRATRAAYNNHTYLRYDIPCSWHRAKAICERLGGHLATVTSEAENNAIAGLFSSMSTDPRHWLGRTKEKNLSTWEWITGEGVVVAPWSTGQPDNAGGVEHYLQMWSKNGQWNDDQENSSAIQGFVCEFEPDYIPGKTIEKNGHLYSIYKEALTWTEAEAACVAMGGHLVSINTAEEQQIVMDLMDYSVQNHYWIGATDSAKEGTWKWIDSGDTFWTGTANGTLSANMFANWYSGEPNNNNGTAEEDYAHIYYNSGTRGTWNDIGNIKDNGRGFICEVDTSKFTPSNTNLHNGNKYERYDSVASWMNAKYIAELKGGHLVTITDKNEQSFIESVIKQGTNEYYSIGVYADKPTKVLHWVTGEEWSYSNWKENQPDYYNYCEFYGQVYNTTVNGNVIGKWNDIPNYYTPGSGFIVEYDNYYADVAVDENNGKEVNYFVAPTVDDGWTENSDGRLSKTIDKLSIIYDPAEEYFVFDTNGNEILTTEVEKYAYLYTFDCVKKLNPDDKVFYQIQCLGGSIESEHGVIVLEAGRYESDRCYIDVGSIEPNSIVSKQYSLSEYQSDNLPYFNIWLATNNSSMKFNQYKLKFSISFTDNTHNELSYGKNTKKVKTDDTYSGVIFNPVKTGYDFTGWKYNDTTITESSALVTTDNHILTASWTAHPCQLIFNANGGTCDTASKTVYYDQTYGELPVPTKDGYTFVGWYTKKKSGEQKTADDVVNFTSDKTLYACWAEGASNVCGENAAWHLNGNKLVISGSGNMDDFSVKRPPWYNLRGYITEVEIQPGITNVGNEAFKGMNQLERVSLAETIDSIGDEAFMNCIILKDFNLTESLIEIGESAFENCTEITEITLPYIVNNVDDYAFDGCHKLEKITVLNPECNLPESLNIYNDDAVVYGYTGSKTEIFAYENDKSFVSIGAFGEFDGFKWIFTEATEDLKIYGSGTMPNFTENTVPWKDCTAKIKSIEFIGDLTNIPDFAFNNCVALTGVTIPDSVTDIGNSAFKGCTNLMSATIPDNTIHIGDSAFCNCSSLTSITIPDSVTRIDDSAFYGCSELTSASLSNSLTNISDYMFFMCTNLKTIDIPNNVTHIGEYAFCYDSNLTEVKMGDRITEIGQFAFSLCTSLVNVDLPEDLTSIGAAAFNECWSLNKIMIPEGVANIGEAAFENCKTLEQAVFSDTGASVSDLANLGNYIFEGCSNLMVYGFGDSNIHLYCDNNNIPFTELDPKSMKITKLPDKLNYYVGDRLDLSGLEYDVFCLNGMNIHKTELDMGTAQPDGKVLTSEGSQKVIVPFKNCSADFIINVKAVVPSSFTISDLPTKTEYFTGEELDCEGVELTLTYNNGTVENVTDGYKVSYVDMSTPGEKTVTVKYKDFTASFDIRVKAVLPIQATIRNVPQKLNYFVGDRLDMQGLTLEVLYNNGSSQEISSGFICTPLTMSKAGAQTVTVVFDGVQTWFDVNVEDVTPQALHVDKEPNCKSYFPGDELNTNGLQASVEYNSGSERVIEDLNDLDIVYDFSTVGEKTVSLAYAENGVTVEDSFTVYVNDIPHVYSDESITANANASFDVPVYISENSGLSNFKFTIDYDKTLFTPTAVNAGQMLSTVSEEDDHSFSMLLSNVNDNPDGKLNIIWASDSALTQSGEIFTITFSASKKADGDYTFVTDYDVENTTDSNGNSVRIDFDDINVHVDHSNIPDEPLIYAESVSANPGEVVSIPIKASNLPAVGNTMLNLKFNTSVFSFSSVSAGMANIIYSESEFDGVNVLFNTNSSVEDGVLFTLNLSALSNASGNYDFQVENKKGIETENATVFVNPLPTTVYGDDITVPFDADTLQVPVYISGNKGLMGFTITVDYEKTAFELISVENGSVLNGCSVDYNAETGKAKITMYRTDNTKANGELFKLKFRMLHPLTSESEIIIDYIQDDTFDENWNDVVLECRNINLKPEALLFAVEGSGAVVNDRFVYGIAPHLTSLNDYVYAKDGYTVSYSHSDFIGTASTIQVKDDDVVVREYNVVLFGDVNGDGWYDGRDSFIVNCITNGMLTREQVGEAKWMAADCNHDGEINSSDVLLLEQAGLLLSNVDQTASQSELIQSDSYIEYLDLIDQNISSDKSIVDEVVELDSKPQTVIEKIIAAIKKQLIIFVYLR